MDAEFRYMYRQMTIIYTVAYEIRLHLKVRLVSIIAT